MPGVNGDHPPDDGLPAVEALYAARLAHVRRHLADVDVDALLVCDPNDVFYATGAMNMQIFSFRSPARYLLVVDNGPTILYEYRGCEHLAAGLPTIDEIRVAEGLDLVTSGGDAEAASQRLADEVAAELGTHHIRRCAIDRFPFHTVDALRRSGVDVVPADTVLSPARAIKLPAEVDYMREAMRRVELAVEHLERAMRPGMTETEAWAHFHFDLMAKDGQHVVTRLFQSGPNTYPYFREAGQRVLRTGDLVCLDTDANGFENYCVDFSRTFLCGDGQATGDQRTLYGRAREQLEWNAALLEPGIEFEELARRAWPIPDEHRSSRYYCIGHGLGMAGEWPNIPHFDQTIDYPLNGHVEPGMVICIESYIGSATSRQGVKLEDQYLIRSDGVEPMSRYPFDDRLSS